MTKKLETDPVDYRRRLGDVLWNLRSKLGLSQKEVASASDVTRQYYGLLERGEINVSVDTLVRICNVLQVVPSQVFVEVERDRTDPTASSR
ncbi:helix-turn-helix domain-containing protein [Paraburkholderia caribensis]|uniref:helix-turn-helix domain-containing protein n=1 Tax=Paraburkholderia TaxID=1822464 RepID=UPI001CAAD0C5|nr:helix-turn-helix transcriptional regulator [Paraburkholderia sp. 22B1P]CAG9251000.1 SOS-response repressor and protease LexA [Paraburkholderia caribensis]